MLIKKTLVIPLLLMSCLAGCSQDESKPETYVRPGYDFPYRLAEPGRSWRLPGILYEISGISFIDDHHLACVQDENGIIFIYDLEESRIEREIAFAEAGDYEGIEIVGNDVWILKSNGVLYEVKDFQAKAGTNTRKHSTVLSGINDTEGLGFYPVKNSLLVACKEQPFAEGAAGKGFRAVYRFSLETKIMDVRPFLLISLDSVRYYRNHLEQTSAETTGSSESGKGSGAFKPSGIAVHPLTGDIYLLASAGKLLLVLSGDGVIQAMIKLRPDIFPKPEGICFSPDGMLFISTEGAGRKGAIMEFSPDDR